MRKGDSKLLLRRAFYRATRWRQRPASGKYGVTGSRNTLCARRGGSLCALSTYHITEGNGYEICEGRCGAKALRRIVLLSVFILPLASADSAYSSWTYAAEDGNVLYDATVYGMQNAALPIISVEMKQYDPDNDTAFYEYFKDRIFSDSSEFKRTDEGPDDNGFSMRTSSTGAELVRPARELVSSYCGRSGTGYYQVALTVRDEATLQREIIPLDSIADHHPKYLLTLDDDPPADYNGIKQINALDWLLK